MDYRTRLIAALLLTGCPAGDDAPAATASTETGTPTPPPGAFRLAFEAMSVDADPPLANVTDLVFIPGGSDMLISEKNGRVLHARLLADGVEVLGTFEVAVWTDTDCGLISLALAPDFADTGHVYLARCVDITTSTIDRYTFDASDYGSIAASGVETMRLGEPLAERSWHNVGDIGFDPDGNLWALFGEKTVRSHAEDPTTDLGSLLRVRVADDGQSFEGAPGNPFAADGGSPNVFAYGLRSPFKGLLDRAGRFWVGDVGADGIEEVNVIAGPGLNFGWPAHEGPCDADCDAFVQPLTSWPHGPSQYIVDDPDALAVPQRVVWIGVEYEGRGGDRYDGNLDGRVLAGDLCVGFIRSLATDDAGALVADDPVGHLAHAPAWGEGPDGYVYAIANGGCGAGTIADAPTVLYRAVTASDPG